jgi:hypothetical protein
MLCGYNFEIKHGFLAVMHLLVRSFMHSTNILRSVLCQALGSQSVWKTWDECSKMLSGKRPDKKSEFSIYIEGGMNGWMDGWDWLMGWWMGWWMDGWILRANLTWSFLHNPFISEQKDFLRPLRHQKFTLLIFSFKTQMTDLPFPM